jgi:hypothetical protein
MPSVVIVVGGGKVMSVVTTGILVSLVSKEIIIIAITPTVIVLSVQSKHRIQPVITSFFYSSCGTLVIFSMDCI